MKYVAFLRGINSGQNPSQKMENLRHVFESMGFKNVRTVIASGNVLFETPITSVAALEEKIEKMLLKSTGVVTATIIRTGDEIEKLIEKNPFKSLEISAKEKPNVTFFKDEPQKERLPKEGRGFKGCGFVSGAYCYTVDMTSIKTPEAMLTLEREFGKEITTRTWGTILKVHKALQS